MQEVEPFKGLGIVADGVLARMASAPVEVSGFFAGMRGVEVSPGNVLYGSDDYIRAWCALHRLAEENRVLQAKRDDAVMNEVVVMGDLMLPVGAEVVLACHPVKSKVAKIVDFSTGYRTRPLYRVLLRKEDGSYPEGKDIRSGENELHVYARQLVDFGLTILRGVYHVT